MATGTSTTTSSNQLPLISLCETVAKINMPTLVQASAVASHPKIVTPVSIAHGDNMFKLSLSNGEVHPIGTNNVAKIVPTVATLTVSRDLKVDGSSSGQKPIIVTVSGMQGIAAGKQLTNATNALGTPLLSTPLQMVTPHFGSDKISTNSTITNHASIPRGAITTATAVLTASGLQTKCKSPSLAPLLPGSIITSKNIGSLPMVVANANTFMQTPATSTITTISPVTLSSSIVTVTPVMMTSGAPMVSIPSNSALGVNQNGVTQTQVLTPVIKVPLAASQKNLVPTFIKPINMTPVPTSTQVTLQPSVNNTPSPTPPSPTPAVVNGVNPKSDPANPDFDVIQALDWKDGVGSLPGSEIKFKLNEFGTLEIVNEDADMPATPKEPAVSMAIDSAPSGTTSRNALKENFSKMKEMYQTDNHVGEDTEQNGNDDNKSDISTELSRCENCDCFGLKVEFCKAGRFCSQVCVAAFAHKRNIWLKKGSKDGRKRRKRKISDAEDEELSNKDAKIEEKEKEPEVAPAVPAKEVVEEVAKPEFCWNEYLKKEKAVAAPLKLFSDSQGFPTRKNEFEVGMKLEGIDPKHPSLFCALTVAEVKGFRVRLHFDGYSDRYDFWVNADSPDVFPVGWCEKTGHKLQPPKAFTPDDFTWDSYLKMSSKFVVAPRCLFSVCENKSSSSHGFKIGMKLEAVDKKNSSLVCVATVADIMDNRFLIHFDGWEDIYDYWTEPNSPSIHPINWCQENGHELTPPKEFKGDSFCWSKYLMQTKSLAVPTRAFKPCSSNNFKPGMKIEAVDKRNSAFIRVATIIDRTDHTLLIHFDGWSSVYDYWVDDDCPDIHPITWCSKTGHPLERPVDSSKVPTPGQGGCPTLGCPGLGHMKGPRHTTHHSSFGCPYSQLNIDKFDTLFQDRVIVTKESYNDLVKQKVDQSSTTEGLRRCPTPGCNGSGHVKGKYSVHHGVSGCPIAAQQDSGIASASSTSSSTTGSSKDSTNSTSTSSSSNSLEAKTSEFLRNRTALGKGKKKKLHGTGLRGRPPKALVLLRAQQAAQQRRREEAAAAKAQPPASSSVSSDEVHKAVFDPPVTKIPDSQLLSWERLSKLLPKVHTANYESVKHWTVDEVAYFVMKLTKAEDISKAFVDQIIDGEAFMLLNQEDIINILKVKLGPAVKIYNSILLFRSQKVTALCKTEPVSCKTEPISCKTEKTSET